MIDERILAVAGVAVLILVVQGALHLFLTATGVYLPDPAPDRDSSDDRRVLLEYRALLRERFHRVFGRSDEPPGEAAAVSGEVPRSRPNAGHGPGTSPEEVRARVALVRDHPDSSRFRFQTGTLVWPTLVLLLILSTVFNW